VRVSFPAVPEIVGLYVPEGVDPVPPLTPVEVGPLHPTINDAEKHSAITTVASASLPNALTLADRSLARINIRATKNASKLTPNTSTSGPLISGGTDVCAVVVIVTVKLPAAAGVTFSAVFGKLQVAPCGTLPQVIITLMESVEAEPPTAVTWIV